MGNLVAGNFGLTKTALGFGVAGGLAVTLALGSAMTTSTGFLVPILGLLGIWVYALIVAVAIWNAAKQHEGSAMWGTVARGGAVIGVMALLWATAKLVGVV